MSEVMTEDQINDVLEFVRRQDRMVARITTCHANILSLAVLIRERVKPLAHAPVEVKYFQGQNGKINLDEDETLGAGVWRFFDTTGKLAVEVTL